MRLADRGARSDALSRPPHEPFRLTGGRDRDGRPLELGVAEGRIVAAAGLAPDGPCRDAGGALVLPGLVESHVHLDKTLLGTPWRPHAAADSVAGRVANEKAVRRDLTRPVEERASLLLGRCLAAGTTRVRSHVDLDETVGLAGLEALLGVRETWRGRIDVEIVAFPQSGILRCPPARELIEAALAAGADLVGGLDPIGFDGDLGGHLDVVFALAESHGAGIDIHLHDRGEAGLAAIREVALRARAAGLAGRVTISHAFALSDLDAHGLDDVSALLADAGVAVLSSVPGGAHCPPIPALLARGVEVMLGTDNIRDAWSPMTVIGMVERMSLCAWRFGLRRDEDLAALLPLATDAPHRVMGLPPPLSPGARADFILVAAENVPQMIAERIAPRAVFKDGRLVWGETGSDPA